MSQDSDQTRTARLARPLYLCIGWTFVVLAIVGAFLPILPTTPFLLIALWAFTKSSPAAAAWLREHPMLGPYIRDWQDHRSIPVRAKVMAVVFMSGSYAWLVFGTDAPTIAKVIVGIILLGAATFVTTRPNPPG